MTYGQAKKDFAIFAVFVPTKDKKGKTKFEQIDSVPDDTEGRVGIFDTNEGFLLSATPRLCFVAKKEEME